MVSSLAEGHCHPDTPTACLAFAGYPLGAGHAYTPLLIDESRLNGLRDDRLDGAARLLAIDCEMVLVRGHTKVLYRFSFAASFT